MAFDGTYDVTIDAMGKQVSGTLVITTAGTQASGTFTLGDMRVELEGGQIKGDQITGSVVAPTPMGEMKLKVKATVAGDIISGTLNAFIANATFTGTRV